MRLNGQIAGVVQPSGAFYRDVPPGYYTVAVNSYGAPYPHQFADFNLGAGQEAFVEVLSMREKVGTAEGLRTLFFHSSSRLTSLAPPSLGRPFTAAASGRETGGQKTDVKEPCRPGYRLRSAAIGLD